MSEIVALVETGELIALVRDSSTFPFSEVTEAHAEAGKYCGKIVAENDL